MTLAETICARLAAVAEPERAAGMQAYMKSTMPYLGVSAVPLRQVCKEVFADLQYESASQWHADVLVLWRGARFREERYTAIELTGLRAAHPFQRIDALPMYEEMIVTGAWWDYIDPIAGQRFWAILQHEREPMKRAMLAWAVDENVWKRRSAILCQLRAKQQTDLDFLYACIAPSIASKEFFLRKAIGWALRQHAWTDPAEVVRYVETHPELSGLSKREALKNVGGRS
ncbi:DNA alkylation repair protein [Sphingobium fuliginis]|jgi:3-methyladenine DNA glycosylase AlkD|uniref:DNA alkylation repair protein n=1 Tax=Sphingobium fuliginis (strain ATCC 27551) TaxID=336203 RepID=A0A7M2GJP9_SPHSA|nr:DNA alkylation repair protein [Sphingobium fuliginis]QOT72322.1 DNA alkylation repair protein [Sphingobium fuliginis]